MRILLVFFFLSGFSSPVFSQTEGLSSHIPKNSFYFYWGWNRGAYTNSDISFSGENYNFTLDNVQATDRQSRLSKTYFSPKTFTIPQYNFRVGYTFKDNLDISFGIDHMKYVVVQGQTATINGNIDIPASEFNGTYSNEKITLNPNFLLLEHTDGLNYVNLELRHSLFLFNKSKWNFHFKKGIGLGAMYPRTNSTLFGQERYDEFHLSGYGISAMAGMSITRRKRFFIQPEVKAGFINLTDIRTTQSKLDRAQQHFFFTQLMVVFGVYLNTK